MDTLRVSLFGGFRVTHDRWPADTRLARTGQALLAYLLLHGRRGHSRDVLGGLLWGEHSSNRARSCLSTALWRLRNVLEPAGVRRGAYLITTASGEVSFNWQSERLIDAEIFELDLTRFLEKPVGALEAADVGRAADAIKLYSGDLLEGFYYDWALLDRERMRNLYLNSLARLLHYYKQRGAYDQALLCGQQILQQDELREDVHREMMRLYLAAGQRTLALRQYDVCRARLAEDLGVQPMEETQALQAQIAAGSVPLALPDLPATQESLLEALEHFHRAIRSFEEAKRDLERAVQCVDRLANRRP